MLVITYRGLCCTDVSESDSGQSKDEPDKKAGQKVTSSKPNRQQECIVCKKVGAQHSIPSVNSTLHSYNSTTQAMSHDNK